MCRLSWNLGASTSWNPHGLSGTVQGLLLDEHALLNWMWVVFWKTRLLFMSEIWGTERQKADCYFRLPATETFHNPIRSRDGSPTDRGLIPNRCKILSNSPNRQTGCVVYPASYRMSTGASWTEGKAAGEWHIPPSYTASVKNEWSNTSFPHVFTSRIWSTVVPWPCIVLLITIERKSSLPSFYRPRTWPCGCRKDFLTS